MVDSSGEAAVQRTARCVAPTEAEILILGGGAAGLSSAAALGKIGLSAVVLERDTQIGGSWTRRYDRLHLHTIRQLSGLAHLPIPRRYPRYLSRDQFVRYLRGYARRLKLSVITGCEVKSVTPVGGEFDRRWQVDTAQGTWRSRVVVVATGQYSVPLIPAWPGLETFGGQLIHSSQYRNGRAWAGKRALVIGVGNSGAEIATDLAADGAASVAVSIRTAPFLTRRDTLGVPVQLIGFVLGALPAPMADWVAQGVMRSAFGDLSRYGITAAGYSPYRDQRVPVIDVGFAAVLKQGRVTVRPDVVGFTAVGVEFSDAHEEPFDLVVAATGYSSGLSRLLPAAVLDATGYPLATSGEPTPWPGLYFIGFTHSLHGHLFEANRSSRRLARHIAAYLKP